MQARVNTIWGAEEDGEAKGKEIRGVTEVGENVTGNSEILTTNLDDRFGFKKLRNQTRY